MTQDRIWRELSEAQTHVNAGLERELYRQHQLRLSEYHALSSLADAVDGSLRMQDLADAVGLNQSSVTRIVARLEAQGLCERCLCPDDRRGVFTRLHEAGRARAEAAAPTYRKVLAEECARWGLVIEQTEAGLRFTLTGR
ncbi:MarR family transcriptional regulator [Streptomyces sp. ISL-12]|nr:MarR family transcriptional regulator [Streptomyces sp. ISL-12]